MESIINKRQHDLFFIYISLILREFCLIFLKSCNLIDNFIYGTTQRYLCHGALSQVNNCARQRLRSVKVFIQPDQSFLDVDVY